MTYIHPTAVIYDNVDIGENVYIGPFCVIGAPPEHSTEDVGPGKGVSIADNVRLEKAVVVDSGIERKTVISYSVRAMSGAHVGHDAYVSFGAVLSPKCCVGGFTYIGSQTNVGMGAVIHQKCTIRPMCMIGMGAVITKAVSERMQFCETWAGNPARLLGPNKKYVQ